MQRKILFVDREGALTRAQVDGQMTSLEKIRLMPNVIPALLKLKSAGFEFVLVSNYDSRGADSPPKEEAERIQKVIQGIFSSQGIPFLAELVSSQLPSERVDGQQPAWGGLTRFLATHDIDIQASAVIGGHDADVELASHLGIAGYRIEAEGSYDRSWSGIADSLCHRDRLAICKRKTRETSIEVYVNLDSHADPEVASGIGFFDHMLDQLAKHGGFSLRARCEGDLHIDDHHTVEDVAIAIGTALRDALGTKHGIQRYGFLLPMDESEAQVSMDLSGRAAFVMTAEFPRDEVGGLTVEMVRHFFLSLSSALGCALHIHVRGENTHHMVEACFKAVGRALRQAVRVTPDVGLPTTKGLLS